MWSRDCHFLPPNPGNRPRIARRRRALTGRQAAAHFWNHCWRAFGPGRQTNSFQTTCGVLKCKKEIKAVCPQTTHSELDELSVLSPERVKSWMENTLNLITLRIDEDTDQVTLWLLEAFLQCKLRPLFEGDNKGHGSMKQHESHSPPTQEQMDRLMELLKLPKKPTYKETASSQQCRHTPENH